MGTSLFKNAIFPAVGNSWQTVYTAPAGQAALLLQLNGAVVAAADLVGSARIWDSSASQFAYLIKAAAIPTGDTIRLIDQAKVVLEENDFFQVQCDSPLETIDYTASVIEDINDNGVISLGTYKNAIVPNVGNSWTPLYTAPIGKTSYFLQINAANIADSGIQVSIRIYDSSEATTCYLLGGAPVPIADAIRLIDNSKIVLESEDRIDVICTTPGEFVDMVGSLIEDVNQV